MTNRTNAAPLRNGSNMEPFSFRPTPAGTFAAAAAEIRRRCDAATSAADDRINQAYVRKFVMAVENELLNLAEAWR